MIRKDIIDLFRVPDGKKVRLEPDPVVTRRFRPQGGGKVDDLEEVVTRNTMGCRFYCGFAALALGASACFTVVVAVSGFLSFRGDTRPNMALVSGFQVSTELDLRDSSGYESSDGGTSDRQIIHVCARSRVRHK